VKTWVIDHASSVGTVCSAGDKHEISFGEIHKASCTKYAYAEVGWFRRESFSLHK
jgi:hypothetical protein